MPLALFSTVQFCFWLKEKTGLKTRTRKPEQWGKKSDEAITASTEQRAAHVLLPRGERWQRVEDRSRSPAIEGTDPWLQLGCLKTTEPWTSLNLGRGRMILVVVFNVCVLPRTDKHYPHRVCLVPSLADLTKSLFWDLYLQKHMMEESEPTKSSGGWRWKDLHMRETLCWKDQEEIRCDSAVFLIRLIILNEDHI